jgi:hypothetical protein
MPSRTAAKLCHDDAALTDAARAALRRALGRRLQKRPGHALLRIRRRSMNRFNGVVRILIRTVLFGVLPLGTHR